MGIAKLKKELENLPEDWVVMLETTSSKIVSISREALKILVGKRYTGIILSANKPCSSLISSLRESGIAKEKLFVICSVCGKDKKDKTPDNVVHVQHSTALTEMAVALGEAMKSIKGKKFVFIDSITSMLIHNESKTLARFIHSILTKMRNQSTNGIIISMDAETEKEIRLEIAQLCDKVIRV